MFFRKPNPKRDRSGIAATELAILLPILATIVLGTIEITSVIRLKQRMNVIAYECARVGAMLDSSQAEVDSQRDLLAEDAGLSGVVVEMSPSDLTTLESGDWLTATVSVPLQSNSNVSGWFVPDGNLIEAVTLQVP